MKINQFMNKCILCLLCQIYKLLKYDVDNLIKVRLLNKLFTNKIVNK